MGECRNCLLPDRAPGAALNAAQLCSACHAYPSTSREALEQARQRHALDLEQTLRTRNGHAAYDCLVNLSGGKDSCYLLYKLVREYGLKVLAFTTHINLPPVAWENIRRTVQALDVEHLVYTPPQEFYRKMFRHLLRNQEARGAVRTVCYVCAPLFEGFALQAAVGKRIPLVVAGYSPGQPEPERMRYEFAPEMIRAHDWTPPELRASGLFSAAELDLFWNPFRYPSGTSFPRYLAPFHAWPYHQDEVMKKVVELGLIASRSHASPVHSNCPVNWLLMYSDLKNLGYNPYTPEFSRLIREGKASRRYWKFMGPVVDFMIRRKVYLGRNVKTSLRWLGLREEELRITRPASTSADAPTGNAVPVEQARQDHGEPAHLSRPRSPLIASATGLQEGARA